MKSSQKLCFLLTILVFANQIFFVINPISEGQSFPDSSGIRLKLPVVNYVDHDPILITNDDNFTDYGFSGNGSAVNPYLIENLEISTLDHYFIDNCIQVEDTTKHFIIQNCLLTANSKAIFVTNVSANTATIFGNKFEMCLVGISFSRAEGIVVTNNDLSNCENNGIIGSYINMNATITNNIGTNHEGSAIGLNHCLNVTIMGNECTNGVDKGISISNSTGYIASNICSRNEGTGIYVTSTDFDQPIYLWNNTCEYNGGTGIYVRSDDFDEPIYVWNNTCDHNEGSGIYVGSSDFNRPIYFWNNTCAYNDDAGIFSWIVTEAANNTLNYNSRGLEVREHASLVLNNTIRGNNAGVEVESLGVFSKNKCLRNRGTGLFFDESKWYGTNITDNIFFANSYGIVLEGDIEEVNISYNLFQENDGYGIHITYKVVNTTIHHNTFLDNNEGGSSQGFDSQSKNLWFDLATEEGNYWSDWTGEGWYLISGGENADIYPLAEPLHERFVDPIPGRVPYALIVFAGLVVAAIIGVALYVILKRTKVPA